MTGPDRTGPGYDSEGKSPNTPYSKIDGITSLPKIEVRNLSKWYSRGTVAKPRVQDSLTDMARRLTGRLSKPACLVSEDCGFWALRHLSFSVQAGERLGIVGLNGSGKSTLLKILSRITAPTEGHAVLRGKVSALLQIGAGFHPDISGRENIFLYGSILGIPRSKIVRQMDAIIDFSGIESFIDTPVKLYSSGMYLRLAFSVSVHAEPDILLLDEVLSVGDHLFREKCREKVSEMVSEGVTLLLVSHEFEEVERYCQRVILLKEGRLMADGPPESVLRQFAGSNYLPSGARPLSPPLS